MGRDIAINNQKLGEQIDPLLHHEQDIPTAQELDDPLRRLDLLRTDTSQPIKLRRSENQGPSTGHCTDDWSAAQVVAHASSPTCDP
jgi:hypothetical protein